MTINYAGWEIEDGTASPAGEGIGGALRGLHPLRSQNSPKDRWLSMGVSAAAQLLLAWLLLHATVSAIKPKLIEHIITVTFDRTEVTPPAPTPPEVPRPPVLQQLPPPLPAPSVPTMQITERAAAITAPAPPPSQPPAPSAPAQKIVSDPPITPPSFDADYLKNPPMVYPNMSRRLREVGTVQLRVRVSADGLPLEILMSTSSGYPRLDDAAKTAVKNWHFKPAMQAGAAIEAWVLVPIEFSLNNSH